MLNETHSKKYQKYVLDVALKSKFFFSYGMIQESKEIINELIYQRRREYIDSDYYIFNHYKHFARISFLEHEIDNVRQALSEQLLTDEAHNSFFGENVILSNLNNYTSKNLTKEELKGKRPLFHFMAMHTGLLKTPVPYDRLSKREQELRDFEIQVETEIANVISKSTQLIEIFTVQSAFDDDLRKICESFFDGEIPEGMTVKPIDLYDIKKIVQRHNNEISTLKEKEIVVMPEIKEMFVNDMIKRKEEWYTQKEALKPKPQMAGGKKTAGK